MTAVVRYNFDRYRKGRLMAEGVAVHAGSVDEACAKAMALLYRKNEVLRFTDNAPCTPLERCSICNHAKATASSLPQPEKEKQS